MNRLKLLLLSSAIAILPGCAVWDAYWLAGYDNQEYALINKIRTVSEYSVEECKDPVLSEKTFVSLYRTAVEFKNFTQYIPDNPDAFKLARNMVDLTKQGKEMYEKETPPSEAFCKLKLKSINRAAETTQQVLGKKAR